MDYFYLNINKRINIKTQKIRIIISFCYFKSLKATDNDRKANGETHEETNRQNFIPSWLISFPFAL